MGDVAGRTPPRRGGRAGWSVLGYVALVLAIALVAAGVALGVTRLVGDDEPAALAWYVYPDNGGQAALAARCDDESDDYTITVRTLPFASDAQHRQAQQRLADEDTPADILSLDTTLVPEFAAAGLLRPFTDRQARDVTDGVLGGARETATWDGRTVAAPFWANTQLLWYRRSVAEWAGLDPARSPVTWDQVIRAAEHSGTTVSVIGGPNEGFALLITTLVASAGGEVLTDAEAGGDATPALDSGAGEAATGALRKIADGAPDRYLASSDEERARAGFEADDGAFMVNWPYTYDAARQAVADGDLDQSVFDDIAWARVPRVLPDRASTPIVRGTALGIGAATKHPAEAVAAVRCLTSVESQVAHMLSSSHPGARAAVYDDPDVRAAFPMADALRDSIDTGEAGPRTPYYSNVTDALIEVFHPPQSVVPASTPAEADEAVAAALRP
jgi:multiple sugar transport system substrate-binding protein